MAKITLKGNEIETCGNLPAVGSKAPDFRLTNGDLANVALADFSGKKLVMNIFPSVDTPVCAASIRNFNEKAAEMDNVNVLCISADLPFAQKRFCGAEEIEGVITLATFRGSFPKDYGVEITTGPLQGLCARAVVVADESGKVLYTELVPEIAQEPNYEAALAALQ